MPSPRRLTQRPGHDAREAPPPREVGDAPPVSAPQTKVRITWVPVERAGDEAAARASANSIVSALLGLATTARGE